MQVLNGDIGNPCFYLFIHYEDLEEKLKSEFDSLLLKISQSINSEQSIEVAIKTCSNEIFRLRLMALRSFLENEENIAELLKETFPFFEELATDKDLGVLGENVLFALRTNMKVASQLINTMDGSEEFSNNVKNSIRDLEKFSYEMLVSSIKSTSPTELSKPLIEWLDVSIAMEFVILSAALLKDKKVFTSPKVIDDLASTMAYASQTHYALAIEIDVLKMPLSSYHSELESIIQNPDKAYIEEQKKIADLDLKSFSKNWD
jgi:hypothetical protein